MRNKAKDKSISYETRHYPFERTHINHFELRKLLGTALKGENESHFDRAAISMGMYTSAPAEDI